MRFERDEREIRVWIDERFRFVLRVRTQKRMRELELRRESEKTRESMRETFDKVWTKL